MSDRPSLDRCPRCGHDHGTENWPLCLCDCYRVADDQRTGHADTAPQAHTDAVARAINAEEIAYDYTCDAWDGPRVDREWYRVDARAILDSTDPAVHAALLDALTRHGVLTEEEQVVRAGYRPDLRRRLVTRWEPTP